MQTREEAMRAAALAHYADPERQGISPIATAGADAELARVVAFMREDADKLDAAEPKLMVNVLQAEGIRELADAIEARAHWGDDA